MVSSTVSGLEYLAFTVHRDPAKSKLVGVNLGCQPAPLSRSRLQAPMASSRIYPGEYGAVGEIEIRQLFEPERSDASN